MTITLNSTDFQVLQTMEAQAQSDQIGYWQIYQWLADTLQDRGVSRTDSTILWLRGATEANAARGAMYELIRQYTSTQSQLRYGIPISAATMHATSNAIAQNMLDDLLGRNEPNWHKGDVPDITRIAFADATAVGRTLFNQDLSDTAAEQKQNSAWSGTLLFTLLRSDQTGRLLSTGAAGTLDSRPCKTSAARRNAWDFGGIPCTESLRKRYAVN